MIYIFDDMVSYTDELYYKHLSCIPEWRKKQVLSYKRLEDRKKSVLAFILLMLALDREYGITDIGEFYYNEYGKPFIKNFPVSFSFSHCKNAVACAVSKFNIGVDVEDVEVYNHMIAQRVCSDEELKLLATSSDSARVFGELWTAKESISKFEGMGLSMGFDGIETYKYKLISFYNEVNSYSTTICYGKIMEEVEPPEVEFVTLKDLPLE